MLRENKGKIELGNVVRFVGSATRDKVASLRKFVHDDHYGVFAVAESRQVYSKVDGYSVPVVRWNSEWMSFGNGLKDVLWEEAKLL